MGRLVDEAFAPGAPALRTVRVVKRSRRRFARVARDRAREAPSARALDCLQQTPPTRSARPPRAVPGLHEARGTCVAPVAARASRAGTCPTLQPRAHLRHRAAAAARARRTNLARPPTRGGFSSASSARDRNGGDRAGHRRGSLSSGLARAGNAALLRRRGARGTRARRRRVARLAARNVRALSRLPAVAASALSSSTANPRCGPRDAQTRAALVVARDERDARRGRVRDSRPFIGTARSDAQFGRGSGARGLADSLAGADRVRASRASDLELHLRIFQTSPRVRARIARRVVIGPRPAAKLPPAVVIWLVRVSVRRRRRRWRASSSSRRADTHSTVRAPRSPPRRARLPPWTREVTSVPSRARRAVTSAPHARVPPRRAQGMACENLRRRAAALEAAAATFSTAGRAYRPLQGPRARARARVFAPVPAGHRRRATSPPAATVRGFDPSVGGGRTAARAERSAIARGSRRRSAPSAHESLRRAPCVAERPPRLPRPQRRGRPPSPAAELRVRAARAAPPPRSVGARRARGDPVDEPRVPSGRAVGAAGRRGRGAPAGRAPRRGEGRGGASRARRDEAAVAENAIRPAQRAGGLSARFPRSPPVARVSARSELE